MWQKGNIAASKSFGHDARADHGGDKEGSSDKLSGDSSLQGGGRGHVLNGRTWKGRKPIPRVLIAASRTRPWLASGWVCRGRRLCSGCGNVCRRACEGSS